MSITERELLAMIERIFPQRADGLELGIGDDCAAIRPSPGHETLITVDTLIEGTHFSRKYTTPRDLARKSMAVSLSDIAAMGGAPRFALLSLNFTRTVDRRWIGAYLKEFRSAAERFGCVVAGGNVALAPRDLSVTVTAVGEVKRGRRVDRSGARPGDAVYVTGTPGDSALGFDLLRANRPRYRQWERRLMARHTRPEPRVAWGRALANKKIPSAMIDISDGVAIDLRRMLAASGVSARIGLFNFPLSKEAARIVETKGEAVWRRILSGGEDYELLFTVPPGRVKKLERLIAEGSVVAARIGQTMEGRGSLTVADRSGNVLALEHEGFLHGSE